MSDQMLLDLLVLLLTLAAFSLPIRWGLGPLVREIRGLRADLKSQNQPKNRDNSTPVQLRAETTNRISTVVTVTLTGKESLYNSQIEGIVQRIQQEQFLGCTAWIDTNNSHQAIVRVGVPLENSADELKRLIVVLAEFKAFEVKPFM